MSAADLIRPVPQINRASTMNRLATKSSETLRDRCAEILRQEAVLREGGGKAGLERQRKLGRLPARERIALLLDKDSEFFELGVWAAYKMYQEWGNIAAAGTVAGIGDVAGLACMIIANDASVKRSEEHTSELQSPCNL